MASSVTAFAAGSAPQPNICTRACWGASSASTSYMSSLTRAIVHHTAGSEFNTSGLEASKANVRAIQSLHKNNGWGDIGYHFLVDKYGNIFEGRIGSMSSLPRGAHDATNTNSFGFNIMGYFHPSVNNIPTAAMLDSLYDVIAWRMPAGWTPYGSPGVYGELGISVGRVDAHRRVKATACPGDHMFNPYMGSNVNAGAIRDEIQARMNGAPPTINPPFTFGGDAQGWTLGNGLSGLTWTNCCGWPGVMYADQVGGDGFFYSPPTNFTGAANQLVHVRVFPQGTATQHDMKVYWRTAASTGWDEAKSSPLLGFVKNDAWFDAYFPLNGTWTGQNVIQMRLDVDVNNQATRWIIDTVEVVNINQPPWTFDGDTESWSAGNGVTGFTWSNCCGWPGIIYADQNANDANFYSPKCYFAGNSGDWIKVHVYAQNGTTANHDMQVFWGNTGDPDLSAGKSSAVVNFTAQNGWADVYLQVGNNAAWAGKTITQVRLDFDQTNTATRWIVDSVEIVGAPPTPPAAPSGLGATAASGSQINLAWTDNANNESNFVVGRSTTSGGPYTDIATLGANVTSYNSTGLSPNTTYYYAVRATNGGGASANSPEASATTLNNPPAAPSGLSATASGTSQINLSWTDNSSDENNFVVGRSTTSGGPYSDIATLPSNTTSYNNTGLAAGTTYYFVVRATNASGSSPNSAQASASTLPNPPSAPSGLSASGISTTQVNLSWTDASSNEANFVVARSATAGGPYTDIATLGANVTSYSNTGLAANTTYYYVVRATNTGGASANSNEAAGVTWPSEIIVDNSSASFTASANWSTGTSAADKYGADYRFRSTAALSDQAVWNVTIPQTRNYEVYAWWTQGSNRATAASYTLPDTSAVSVNQQTGGGAWNSLGTKALTAGAGTVKLSCWTTTGFVVVADAVRLVPR